MKKIIAILVITFSVPAYAALGVFKTLESIQAYTDPPGPTVVRWSFTCAYEGGDVPGITQNAALTVQVSSSTPIATVAANIVATIKAEGTNRGFNVPTVYLPSYISQ